MEENTMKLFPDKLFQGRTYSGIKNKAEDLQKKAEEVSVRTSDRVSERMNGYKEIMEGLESLKFQQEDIQHIKEKQEYILKNFPTLESNIVEKIKHSGSQDTEVLMLKINELEEKVRKNNIWNKVLLAISTVCGLVGATGIVIVILYIMEVI